MEVCQIANLTYIESLVVTLPLVGFLGFFMTGNVKPTITSLFLYFDIYIYIHFFFLQLILWPFLLKMIIPRDYIGAAATVRLFLRLVAYSL
jgi:hypothetical protein